MICDDVMTTSFLFLPFAKLVTMNRCFILLVFINIYIYIYIYKNFLVNAIFRLPNPSSGDRKCLGTFLAPSADKRKRNYGTECSNHHPSLSTLRSKGLAIYTNLPVDSIVSLVVLY